MAMMHACAPQWLSRAGRWSQVPWRKVLTNKPFLAVFIAHAGWGFGHTIYYAWLPNFYYTEYGLPISDSAWLSALPWVCTVLVTNAGGYFADKLVNDGVMSRLKSRRIMQVRPSSPRPPPLLCSTTSPACPPRAGDSESDA